MTATPGKDVAGVSHSPEPWTYEGAFGLVWDANGAPVADMDPTGSTSVEQADANGHRIAALSAENAALRAELAELRAKTGGKP